MTKILIIFLLFILAAAFILFIIMKLRPHKDVMDIDEQYLDENGDHTYYDRSLIEKKEYARLHPESKNIRTLSSLFTWEKSKESDRTKRQ